MNATREDPQRSIDFGAVADHRALDRAICALLRRRKNPMTQRQIERWFRATPTAAIHVSLTVLVGRDGVVASRTGLGRRWVLEYSISGDGPNAPSPESTMGKGTGEGPEPVQTGGSHA